MGSTICKNDLCAATTSHDWKKGWPLRSGGFANLCYNCGSAYEKLVYCEMFHSEETGWRDCSTCGKKLHCGCVVSKSLYEFLDHGGVGCINCANRSRVFTNNEVHKGLSGPSDVVGSQSPLFPNRGVGGGVDEGRLMQLCKIMEDNKHEIMPNMGEVGREFSSATLSSVGLLPFSKLDNNRMTLGIKDRHESLAEPSLKMTLGTPSRTSNFVLALSSGVGDGREQSKTPSLSFEPQRNRPILPKPLKSGLGGSSESNKGVISPMRIARPPGEGRGKSQLLPRYWPRITDQELEKLSGDLHSSIVPLFEKVLSASDAGRIGRLVLPKACAEAYFPSISQSEGLPLRVQDVKGNEWTFQFRFWPNNNSRMYVLEGVTPCIQAMQLQAGDTVTFSRIDPGGKLVMGFRKAPNNGDIQDGESSAQPNGFLRESSFSGATENPPTANGYPGVHQTNKGSKDALAEHLHLANGDLGLHKSETNGFRKSEDPLQQTAPTSEKKRTRNIGSKSKRLLMHSEDVLELRLTWEEAQDLLRPPPSANPNIVTIEDHEFEEYDVPPVFGKRTLFVSRSPGGQEQWAQCDDCSKWRKLPVEVLLPPKWTCSDNDWDASRGSCSAPEEISLRELENLIRASRDLKKRRTSEHHKSAAQREPSGLDALASAAVLGDNLGEAGEPSSGTAAATTTRHPRHRPGCSCIVCIQPPSGKGKHKPTCTCNVCMTVKRRFKTLMLRKKKLHSERDPEPEPPKKKDGGSPEMNCADRSEKGGGGLAGVSQGAAADHAAETSAGQIIDLNCHPSREDMQMETDEVEVLREPASRYAKQSDTNTNTDASVCEQRQPGFDLCLLEKQKANGDGVKDERYATTTPVVWKREPNRINGIFIDPNLD